MLDDLAVFVEVVESGSFTAAAGRLNLSKSVVSKYVSRLEQQLNTRLMNRTTRRLSLTEAGHIFYERCRKGLNEIADARAEISRLQEKPRGTLRLNTPMSFGILHVAPAIADFRTQYPEIQIDMDLNDRHVDIVKEGYDVSVRVAELPDSSLVARRLTACRHAIVASNAYLEKYGVPLSPPDLASHQILSFRHQDSARQWHFVGRDGAQESIGVSGPIVMNNSLALKEAVLGGAGISRMPTFIVGEDIREKRLVPLLTGYRTLEISIYLIYPQRRHVSPKVRAFVDFMAGRLSGTAYWDRF